MPKGINSVKNDLSFLQSGVYFYKITIGNKTFTERIIKL